MEKRVRATSTKPSTRKGAKGISLFIVRDLRRRNKDRDKAPSPQNAPTQKEKITAVIPRDIPSNQPIPRASLASPSPIQRPPETSQKKAKKQKRIGPARKSSEESQEKNWG